MMRFKHLCWTINSYFAFIIFAVLKRKYYKKNNEGKGIIFINTGSLGDVIISSMILENERIFVDDGDVHLIVKSIYSDLYSNYSGKVKLIFWNQRRYKWSLYYRIQFLNMLHNLQSRVCVNLTSSRGISSDEISLLSGSSVVWCFGNSWKKITKVFSKKIDSYYDRVLFTDIFNEYERHIKLLELFPTIPLIDKKTDSLCTSKNNNLKTENYAGREYIVVAPFSSDLSRGWGEKNYKYLCGQISKHLQVMLVGTQKEREMVERIRGTNKNVANLAGKIRLNEVLQLIENASLFIGNDSGLAHAALKYEIPMIAIIGGGNFERYFPFKVQNNRIFLYNKMDCFGCEWECCYKEKYCLTNVSLNDVYEKSIELLGINDNT